ncbi:hypothetical protein SRM_00723 [Salinibacter ruber M8]|uniref:Uncharacterized protein n=1 Tax=Salinibacter ruber (strain M8) TaxID=761659 RepID=D5H6I9_SALRM|nr:hypothetical protein SRM_00723 [Salinibacter ruber M8]
MRGRVFVKDRAAHKQSFLDGHVLMKRGTHCCTPMVFFIVGVCAEPLLGGVRVCIHLGTLCYGH